MFKYRIIYILIFGLLFLVVGCRPTKEEGISSELLSVDSILFTNPPKAISKLDSMNPNGMPKSNACYYGLLCIIAQENNFVKIKSDSIISIIYDYYNNEYKKDATNHFIENNYAKSLTYFAIIKHNISSKDTLVYSMLKDAQKIFEKNTEPSYYKATISAYLALINNDYKDISLSEQYYKKAFDEYLLLDDKKNIALLKVDRALSQLISRRYDLTFKYLKEIEDEGLLLNDDIKYAYYTAYATYYSTKRDYVSAVKFAKLKMDIKSDARKLIDYSKINYSVSKYYSYMNNVDSAIFYAKLAIDNALNYDDRASSKLQYYYRNVGDIYSQSKMYYESSIAYRKAFFYALNSNLEFHKKKRREVEIKYDLSIKKNLLDKKMAERQIILLFSIVIILALLLFIVLLLYRIRISKATRKNMLLKQDALEQELLQTKSMVDVVSVSLGVLPSFIDKVNDLSAKVFSTDPNLYEIFQKEINSAKSETRKRLLNLVNNELLVKTSPILKYLEILSNQEKMILLLLRQNYSIKYIASVLNITQSSVRGSKVKIKNKIKDLDLSEEIKQDIMLGL